MIGIRFRFRYSVFPVPPREVEISTYKDGCVLFFIMFTVAHLADEFKPF